MTWAPAAISAAGNLLGGLLGQMNAGDARAEARADAAQAREWQVNAFKNQLQWRVEDAKKAGIHPLAAIGAPTFSPAPISVSHQTDSSMPNAVANMGQDIGRAMLANRGSTERDQAFADQMKAYSLEGMRLDNEIKRASFQSSMMRLAQASNANPGFPATRTAIPGQGNTALPDTSILYNRTDPTLSNSPAVPDVTYSKTTAGGLYPVPSKEVKESIEDNIFQETMHFLRNNVFPWFSNTPPSGQGPARPGHTWTYDMFQGYREKPNFRPPPYVSDQERARRKYWQYYPENFKHGYW